MSAATPTPTPAPTPPPVKITRIPDGYAGTVLVIAEMRRLANEALRDERLNQLARKIVENAPPRDGAEETRRVLVWLQTNFRYCRLPWFREGWQRLCAPSWTLFDAPTKSGECASLATAMAALLMSLGNEVRFRTAGQDPADPLFHEHVYLLVNVDGEWIAADPSYNEPLGWPHRPDDRGPAVVWSDWEL